MVPNQSVTFPPDLYAELKHIETTTPGVKFSPLVASLLRKALGMPITNQNPPQIVDADHDEIKKTA